MSILFPENPIYCMDKSDSRFQPTCCHYFSDLKCDGELQLGAEACRSLFGSYELSIPIDDTLECSRNGDTVTDKNCKNFQVRPVIVKSSIDQ